MVSRGALTLFGGLCLVHIGGSWLGLAPGWLVVGAGVVALALLAGYAVVTPSGPEAGDGVSGRARALLAAGLLAVAVAMVARTVLMPVLRVPPGGSGYAFTAVDPALDWGRPYRVGAVALLVAVLGFAVAVRGLPAPRRRGFLVVAGAIAAVTAAGALLRLVLPVADLPALFGGDLPFQVAVVAGFCLAVAGLVRPAIRRGVAVGWRGAALAAGLTVIVLRLWSDVERASWFSYDGSGAFLTSGVRFGTPGLPGLSELLPPALLLAGPVLIVAAAIAPPRTPRPPD